MATEADHFLTSTPATDMSDGIGAETVAGAHGGDKLPGGGGSDEVVGGGDDVICGYGVANRNAG